MLCGTCGQPAEKASAGGAGAQVAGSVSSGSSASSVTVTRSYRSVGGSGGGSFGDNLVTRSYLLGNSRPRTQVSHPFAFIPRGPRTLVLEGQVGVALWGAEPAPPQPGGVGAPLPPQILGGALLPPPLRSEPQTGGQAQGCGQGGVPGRGRRCCSRLSPSLLP